MDSVRSFMRFGCTKTQRLVRHARPSILRACFFNAATLRFSIGLGWYVTKKESIPSALASVSARHHMTYFTQRQTMPPVPYELRYLCPSPARSSSRVLLLWSLYCGSAVRLPHLTTGRGPSCLAAIIYRWSWRVLDGHYCKNGPEG